MKVTNHHILLKPNGNTMMVWITYCPETKLFKIESLDGVTIESLQELTVMLVRIQTKLNLCIHAGLPIPNMIEVSSL